MLRTNRSVKVGKRLKGKGKGFNFYIFVERLKLLIFRRTAQRQLITKQTWFISSKIFLKMVSGQF